MASLEPRGWEAESAAGNLPGKSSWNERTHLRLEGQGARGQGHQSQGELGWSYIWRLGGEQGCCLTELAKPPSAFALPAWNFLPPSQKVKVGGRLEQPFLGSVHGSHNHTFWVSKVLKTEVSLHHIFLSFSIFLMKLK